MSGWNAQLRNLFHREPIILWSCLIGGVGLALPIVVPPIREAIYKPEARHPPAVKELLNKAKQ
jgi:hypothetical protein